MNLENLNSRLALVTKFWFKLLILGAVFQLIIYADPSTKIFQEFLAWYLSIPLSWTSMEVSVTGYSIFVGSNEYIITRDCLGWKSIALFIGLIVATTHKLRNLKYIIPIGILTIIAANNARILSTILLAELGIISWEIIHSILWRWGLAAVVLIIWFTWVRKTEVLKTLFNNSTV